MLSDSISYKGGCVSLASQRNFIRPEPNEDWAEIAARTLPEVEHAEAIEQLQSWNFHVFMRAANPNGKQVLPSDIIFTEAPKAG
ncbi:MAG: hypothetical protein GKR90_10565 [Pseudomonadales bacterium]|nr:hypothetical protein [Pseudomonadales bacterium]